MVERLADKTGYCCTPPHALFLCGLVLAPSPAAADNPPPPPRGWPFVRSYLPRLMLVLVLLLMLLLLFVVVVVIVIAIAKYFYC